MYKLGHYVNHELQEYRYADIFDIEEEDSYKRIVIGCSENHVSTILELIALLNGSFYILYVLHTPRARTESGRYQSEKLSYNEASTILNQFHKYFENDARHDIWIYSPETSTTIVYDRHNLIYIYGYTTEQVQLIEKKGLKREPVEIPVPHVHSYNKECDTFESKLINQYKWSRTPLLDEDR